jgi:hypothetical protein
MLWQKLLRDREANAPWQRLRRNLLLLLQLLILAALILAMARPFIPMPSIASANMVVLLDASASMQATDVEPTRFEAAKTEAGVLIDELSGSSQMTIIEAGQTPRVLVSASSDRTALRRALDEAHPGAAAADWSAAFALAAGAAQGFQDGRIVLISDGGLPEGLPPVPVEIVYVPIGNSGENLAISALATRDTETGPQLFASVSNEGIIDRQALFILTLDGTLFDSRRITIAASETSNLTWELPEGTSEIMASLTDHEGDFLSLDDTAWAVHEGGLTDRALLVTRGNLFLEQAYSLLPSIELFKAQPGGEPLQDPAEAFDLYVFDGVALPEPLPDGDMLIIDPQPAGELIDDMGQLINVTGEFSNTVSVRLADSPLLQFVDWSNVHVRKAKGVVAPWAQPLIAAEGGPLILMGERDGRRIAIITFDLHESDLPLQIAFPILLANITHWLNPGRVFEVPTGLQPGIPIAISPGVSAVTVSVLRPNGEIWTTEADQEQIFFAETSHLGFYRVSLRDQSGERSAGSFAVNLFDPAEASITPAPDIRIGQTTIETASQEDIGQRELWPWLLATAFVVLLAEWWIHHRGVGRPGFYLR